MRTPYVDPHGAAVRAVHIAESLKRESRTARAPFVSAQLCSRFGVKQALDPNYIPEVTQISINKRVVEQSSVQELAQLVLQILNGTARL